MNIILLSGGSGKRLWPLSNDIRSKQFIKMFRTEDGYESMVERMYRQIKEVDENANITIATSKSQVSAIRNQLGQNVNVCIEPCRRDTFPAIALACSYLKDVKKVDENESIIVCPVDPYVEIGYFESLMKLSDLAQIGDTNLSLMGMEPTYPSEKYGYIIPENNAEISKVKTFKEKPNKEVAEIYLEQGALWNGGIFAFKLKYMIDKSHELISFSDYNDLYNKYETLNKISFDYAVVEKEEKIQVLRYSGQWKDLGTWNTLTESLNERNIGRAIFDDSCENVHVLNELDLPILCMGLKNIVVAASPDGILVSDKEQSGYMKPYVESIEQNVMYAEKSWGSYKVIDVEDESQTVCITLNKGQRMSYHSHEYRDEVWIVISGSGMVRIDGNIFSVEPGETIQLPAGSRHTIIATTDLKLIEVQTGHIDVQDKIKYEQ